MEEAHHDQGEVIPEREWQLREVDDDLARQLAEDLGVSPFLARLLLLREVSTTERGARFLNPKLEDLPKPERLNGTREAVERTLRAIRGKEKIAVFGDFDVDGTTSVALFHWFFRAIGESIVPYVPDREREGYGLNVQAIRDLKARGVSLLFTADCGTTNLEEIRFANEQGMDVMVIDHHEVTGPQPEAFVLLNPKKPDSGHPDPVLCSAGLTFHFLTALRAAMREEGAFAQNGQPNLRQHLDLVALATVADVVPLRGVNRVLVHHGLEVLRKTRKPGLRALMDVSRVGGDRLNSHALAFYLAPRINAAGRLGDATRALRLMITEDPTEAFNLARELHDENARRQAIEETVLQEAVAQVDREARGIVVSSESWHAGVIGIVAARLVERFGRPSILIALKDGVGRGSARSVSGLNLVETLASCGDHLLKFGGHRQAAGLSIEADRIPEFRKSFDARVRETLGEDFRLPLRIDAPLNIRDLQFETLDELDRLEPVGEGNARPVFCGGPVRLTVGRSLKGKQLLCTVRDGGRTVDGLLRWTDPEPPRFPDEASVAYTVERRTWQGETSIGIRIRDWKKYEE